MRFAVLVFALQIAGSAVVLLTVRTITEHRLTASATDQAARLRATLLEGWASGGVDALARAAETRLDRSDRPQSVVLVIRRDGRVMAGNVAAWPPNVAIGPPVTVEIFRVARNQPEAMRVIGTVLPDGTRLLTGHVIEGELAFVGAMEVAMVAAMIVALLLAGLAGWAAAKLIAARLGRTAQTVAAVTAGDLDRRVALDGGSDAFEALGRSVNAMLDRIAMLVGELKLATDGLAHDLRSPLTRLRATLERALAAAESEEGRVAVLRAMEEGDRLLGMLDTALRITRAEAGIGREAFQPVDLSALVADVADMFEPLAEDRGLAIVVAEAPAITVPANREMIGQAVANMVDNALKYGAGTIRMGVVEADGAVTITVADDGPGIPADRRGDALRRFGRLDAARTESGAGLGLSLVAAVAHLHGGTLELGDNTPGLAARMTVAR
ncbi:MULTISPECIES: sensor histidine kinase [unclassified Sphingomonas]|uniref:sensor histidine kinase n=1 Tax=unclassified Sphingomonas TaxID=196159 RepID=UPI000B065D27|nr:MULTISPECIES: ATP-binding protein [unclassified Sphingomonas]